MLKTIVSSPLRVSITKQFNYHIIELANHTINTKPQDVFRTMKFVAQMTQSERQTYYQTHTHMHYHSRQYDFTSSNLPPLGQENNSEASGIRFKLEKFDPFPSTVR